MNEEFISRYVNSPEAMEELGKEIACKLQLDSVVFLNGNLGAGKTTLVRGILRGKGFEDAVTSPTFTLVETYEFEDHIVLHIDLYRLEDPEELEALAIRDYMQEKFILLIEWPDKASDTLPQPSCLINIEIVGSTTRVVSIKQ